MATSDTRARRVAELLKRAMERQAQGAHEALDELVETHTGASADAVYASPSSAPWRDPDEAELLLLRFLRRFPV